MPPERFGLYDPANEHDACGLGFVAHLHGEKSRAVVESALQLLTNLAHRGAAGADPATGDGAGILTQIPHAFYWRACTAAGFHLPEAGSYGVGMVFLPRDEERRRVFEALIERIANEEGWRVLGWRDVPTDAAHAGTMALAAQPAIREFFVARIGVAADADDGVLIERHLYVMRKRIEKAVRRLSRDGAVECFVVSLSSRTVIHKGMLHAEQLRDFYVDLRDPEFTSAIATVHSRFSTNTFPSWPLAHPYRYVAHNGEINTVRGNARWMRMREASLESSRFPDGMEMLLPIIAEGQSDSASLDNVLELLIQSGRPIAHAMAMLMPEAWESDELMPVERRAFYEYHASLIEPWDGPAAVVFSDGRQVGATLDRNGLRPIRYLVTDDDLVVLASEAGALDIDTDRVRTKGRLNPGQMLIVNTVTGRILTNADLKSELGSLRPYRRWIHEQRVPIDAAAVEYETRSSSVPLARRQRAFGYTREELKTILAPMAETGEEAIGSMGNDAPLAVLSDRPQLLFSYFRQLFAQVTNPPIDPIREQLVMSLGMFLGPQGNLLDEKPEHARQVRVEQPILTEAALGELRALRASTLRPTTLRALFRASDGPAGLAPAIEQLCVSAEAAVRDGAGILILSDRDLDAEWAAIPSLLAVAAVHHHLGRAGLRTQASLVAETGEARDVSHVALLVGYGASAVCPYLALESIDRLADEQMLTGALDAAHARAHYIKAVSKGLLKVLSKMGISTLQSYCGAQIFEALGLHPSFVALHFTGTASRIGGIDIDVVADEALRRHAAAFATDDARDATELDAGSEYHYRIEGEHHNWNPRTITTLQRATRANDARTFREFSEIVDAETGRYALRGLLDFVETAPVPLDEVESEREIVKRFVTGAMSFGSLSQEAHETLAVAMNRLGGRSNTGEGGEDRHRFRTDRSSAIKQVASGRFGVTTEYLVNADELQIKIAQGAKPGEGGQLPGHKVDENIARTRCATPGVSLISPPPHHDIYSIEDLKQLIHDLANVNPRASISVKLVAAAGIGTIAAGVAKAHADLIVVSGDSGGTGASPLASIKHTGIPWEIGLAEVQQTLVLNGLRGRVRLQTDGQLKTGRDVVLAAILGADEFGFATAPLIVEGCVMMRKCHLNTCPVGIATQDPELRAKFTGSPEHVVNYFFFVAAEVRALMARLGVRTMNELIGRTELLRTRAPHAHWKARHLDLSDLLMVPADGGRTRHFVARHDARPHSQLDVGLLELARPALERGGRISASVPVRNVDRSIGALVSGEVARLHGAGGLADGTISVRCRGSAGQSFGAFAAKGLALELEGEANDYVGKGLSGGRIVVRAPRTAHFVPDETAIVGNTVLYGATSGEAYIGGLAGQRFAVRNSGATAVVEGVGDHGCEYMTGGVVVVLGRTGRNFGAGMSGGLAFVLDESGNREFERHCNPAMIELRSVESAEDRALLRRLVELHARYTGSARARYLLSRWEQALRDFVAVVPVEYARVTRQREQRAEANRVG
jgi:glutamate synthase domain-containing protein 2/glutamate synthase domain-containing protein 1/glutamate synthase domain-containing protein 3